MSTFKIDLYDDHEVGNPDCPRCVYNHNGRICTECNKGIVHEEYNDEDWDGNVQTINKCDNCGSYWG